MKPPASSVPLRRRRLPRWAAILGIVIASLPTAAVVLAFPVANHWVHSNWNQFRAEWESRGEIFELEALLSPVPADEENFAKAPLIAECYVQPPGLSDAHDHDHADHGHGDHGKFHGRLGELNLFETGELVAPQPNPPLAFLSGQPVDLALYLPLSNGEAGAAAPLDRARALFAPHEPLIDELMAAARLPSAHYPVNRDHPSASLLSHLPPLIQALHALRIHNLMLIEAGSEPSDTAAGHLTDTLRLIRHGTASEGLASYSVRSLALESGGLEVVWQALYRQRFSDAQWADIDRELRAFEFGPRLLNSLRFERAALIREVENGFDRRSQRPFSVPPAWVRLSGLMEYAELTQRYWFTDGAA